MRAVVFVAITALGCSERPLTSGSERDSGAIDVSTASCVELMTAIRAWLDSHRACKTIDDCTAIPTVSADDCKVAVNKSAASPYLSALLDAYKNRRECTYKLTCVAWGVVCDGGTCSAKTEP